MRQVETWDDYWYNVKQVVSRLPTELKTKINNLAQMLRNKYADPFWTWTFFAEECAELLAGEFSPYTQMVLDNMFDTLESRGEEIIDTVTNTVSETYDTVVSGMETFSDSIFRGIDDTINDIDDLLSGVYTEVMNTYDKVTEKIGSVFEVVEDRIDAIVSNATHYFSNLMENTNDLFIEYYNSVGQRIQLFYDELSELANAQYDLSSANMNALHSSVMGGLEGVMTDVDKIVNETLAEYSQTGQEVTEEVGTLSRNINENIVPSLKSLAERQEKFFGTPTDESGLKQSNDRIGVLSERMKDILNPEANMIKSMDNLFDMFGQDNPVSSILSLLYAAIVAAMHVVESLSIMSEPKGTRARQEVNATYPVKSIPGSDAIRLYIKRILTAQEMLEYMSMEGISDERAVQLADGGFTEMDLSQAISGFNRKIISEDRLKEIMHLNGYRDSDIPALFELIKQIPAIGDMVTMAVREVYSEDIADRFQIFEDFPEEFATEAAKHGVTEETAKQYWGAHWALPSANQGFEMFHRGIIDHDELSLLLRALDVMPYWRDRMIKLNYTPITRVDIRRFYRLGIFTRQDVVDRHKFIGYSPEDSELMADFTELYVGVDEEDTEVDTKQLAMSSVKRLWSLGTINTDAAKSRLATIGYPIDVADLIVEGWIDEDEVSFRETMINKMIKKAIREDMSRKEIEVLFSDMNTTVGEMERIYSLVEVEQDEYDAIPSKAELVKMLEAKVIDEDTWYNAMRQHKYSDDWITAYRKILF